MNLAEEIRRTQVSQGELMICWLGQAGYLLKDGHGCTLAVDPYLTNCGERIRGFKRLSPMLLPAEDFAPDYYVITHTHFDHLDYDAIPVVKEMGGHRLYFSGDTAFHEELFCGVAKFQPEIVFMSVNGKFGNMNAEEGARAAELTGARYAVPCHCWTFAEHGGDPGLFCECLRGGRCVPVCFRQGEARTLDCKRLFQQMEESA